MKRSFKFIVGILGAALLCITAYGLLQVLNQPEISETPYARWRNGIIVYVRNCDTPRDEATRLRCAGLYCTKRVTELLTNAQQATPSITSVERDVDSGAFVVNGALEQYLHTPTLPTAYRCTMARLDQAKPEFIFGGREALSEAYKLSL